ncbi:MAG: DnaB-like helicase C-terminal domain-containing protein, partial [Candidatus Riflebacteria bacterium]
LLLSKEIAEKEAILASKYLETDQSGNLTEACAELLYRIENSKDNPDLQKTNWEEFDDIHAGGLLPNELIIIAARPSVGKTAAALQIAAGSERPAVIFSLEMNKSKLSARLLAATARQNTRIASRQPSQISEEVRNRLVYASSNLLQIAEKIMVYDQHDQTVESIRRISRKAVEKGAGLIIIDFLQLIVCEGENRQEAIASVSRSLKNMAKELNVPVIVLSQLNRACESEKRLPRLSDLRESGAIEQDADSVVFIHDSGAKNEDGYKKVFLIAAKGRDVGTGFREIIFNHDHQTFYRIGKEHS